MGALANLRNGVDALVRTLPTLWGGGASAYYASYAPPLPLSYGVQWWQLGLHAPAAYPIANAGVEAAVSAITQTVAMLPLNHWKALPNDGRERVVSSAAYRTLLRPNAYQTRAEFITCLLRSELLEGNAYAYAGRSQRGDIAELHLLHPYLTKPLLSDPTAEPSEFEQADIFYETDPNPLAGLWADEEGDRSWRVVVPARDMLHCRLHSGRHPLIGITPLSAAVPAVTVGNSINGHVASFFQKMARPSGYLKVPSQLNDKAGERLQREWISNYSGQGSGNPAVLTGGAEWVSLTMTAVDAQIIDTYRMSIADIARVYRVPLPIIGEMEKATYQNVETLLRHWRATGLGYVIEHLEQALDRLFSLDGDREWLEFDQEYLLRSDFAGRIDGLAKGVQGGIFAPNEARAREGLKAVPFGDMPRVQQQVVPLDWHDKNPPAPPTKSPPAETEDEDEPPDDEAEDAGDEARSYLRGRWRNAA